MYLVEGERSGKIVRQKTLSYLGPLPKLACGISLQLRKRIESQVKQKIDWDLIAAKIRKIPLRFDELMELRSNNYSSAIKFRNLRENPKPIKYAVADSPSKILQERTPGELAALTKLSAMEFERMFKQIGVRRVPNEALIFLMDDLRKMPVIPRWSGVLSLLSRRCSPTLCSQIP